MDDDCKIIDDAFQNIVDAHSADSTAIICFQTINDEGQKFWDYPTTNQPMNLRLIRKVLSPEICLKRSAVRERELWFDTRFGLGAQFQDSENFIFLEDALSAGLSISFVPEFVVRHSSMTSSDEVASNRVVYARGALAGRRNIWTAGFYQLKYVFFLWRKGYVRSLGELWHKYMVFNHGANDYITGFEGHRINHPKQ